MVNSPILSGPAQVDDLLAEYNLPLLPSEMEAAESPIWDDRSKATEVGGRSDRRADNHHHSEVVVADGTRRSNSHNFGSSRLSCHDRHAVLERVFDHEVGTDPRSYG
jgi:hypothetical protein